MKIKKYLKIILIIFIFFVLFFSANFIAHATEDYAEKTGETCLYCHQESIGGTLNTTGYAYIRNGYQYPIPERVIKKVKLLKSPFYKALRFIIGYIHLLAAIIFFGAIFYIHIFIKPTEIKGGIPRAERILGVTCMIILALTGSFLTWMRIDKFNQFFNNTFGFMLFIKIILFIIMIMIGITAITIIHHKMQKETRIYKDLVGSPKEITIDNLSNFDGLGGNLAYFVYKNKVYDVSDSPKWKDGRHFGRHTAGSDLTESLKDAPHGEEVLEKVKFISKLLQQKGEVKKKLIPVRKVFVVMAYINLIIIFLIIFCISVWRFDFPIKFIP